jgi:hypothetical protein
MSDDRRVVKQLDHAIARVDDPQPLFKLLSETLQLPIAWPLRSYPSFTSGGVTLGNLYLEILSCAPQRDTASSPSPEARFAAIAFETDSLAESVVELGSRKIPHGPIVPYMQIEPDGRKTKLYANSILGKMLGSNFWIDTMILMGRLPGSSAMSNPGAGGALVRWGIDKVMSGNLVFLVEYGYGNFTDLPHWSEFKNHDEKRAADAESLRARRGGMLGLESVREIVVSIKDYEKANQNWEKLLAPAQAIEPGLWEIADGPAVRLLRGDGDVIQGLVFKVSDLEKAETFLREKDMLDSTSSDQSRIDPAKLYGLDIRLV